MEIRIGRRSADTIRGIRDGAASEDDNGFV